jgi:hypothetical protein
MAAPESHEQCDERSSHLPPMSERMALNANKLDAPHQRSPELARECVWCGRREDGAHRRWIELRYRDTTVPQHVTATICPDCWDNLAPKSTPYPARNESSRWASS